MAMFRKRSVVVEARQFKDDSVEPVRALAEWCGGKVVIRYFAGTAIEISTLEGTMVATIGDWIIRGVEGEFYPCKPHIFAATYEPAETKSEVGETVDQVVASLRAMDEIPDVHVEMADKVMRPFVKLVHDARVGMRAGNTTPQDVFDASSIIVAQMVTELVLSATRDMDQAVRIAQGFLNDFAMFLAQNIEVNLKGSNDAPDPSETTQAH